MNKRPEEKVIPHQQESEFPKQKASRRASRVQRESRDTSQNLGNPEIRAENFVQNEGACASQISGSPF